MTLYRVCFCPTSLLACALSVLPTAFSSTPASGQQTSASPSYVLVSAPLVLTEKTAVPSRVLAAGTYSIHIVDRISDRYILRIEDGDGKDVGTFIGLHDPDLNSYVLDGHQGPIPWATTLKGSRAALRGFSFPNGNTLEFAYPKAEAVALAQANNNSVVAIDPESEGRKPDPKLTLEDREVVTLWTLTPVRVGDKQQVPGIQAKRFVPPPAAPQTDTTLLARNEPPQQLSPAPSSTPAPVSDAVAAAIRLPKPKTRAVAAKLPQTGSDLPLVALFSAVMLGAAGSLRLTRIRA